MGICCYILSLLNSLDLVLNPERTSANCLEFLGDVPDLFHAFFCFLNESHFHIYIYLQTTCQDLNVCVLLSAPAASHRNSFPGRAGGQVWLTLRAFYLLWAGRRNLIISSYKSNFSCSPFTHRAHSESSTDPPHDINVTCFLSFSSENVLVL